MKVGIVGLGNMGSNIAYGLIKSNNQRNENIYLYNRSEEKTNQFEKYDVNIVKEVEQLINKSQIIILAIKANEYENWLNKYSNLIYNKLFISIGANITSNFLNKYINLYAITMPNIGSEFQQGYTVICENHTVDENLNEVIIQEATKIFQDVGKTKIIKEDELPNYIALIGSSPAYFMKIVQQMSTYFVDQGYDQKFIEQTLAYIMSCSSNIILKKSDKSLEQLINSVCSKKGVTIEGINNMENSSIQKDLYESIQKVVTKSEQ